ncbi:hypothetical protein NT05HA_2174 [Aggregatibacter aphrophilus NJ8700]|nr:hypothetical protein NT05HA_2174 [Aggregatibacter aphrophilus NJ8700]
MNDFITTSLRGKCGQNLNYFKKQKANSLHYWLLIYSL